MRAQNVWIENNADHFGCIPKDSIRLQVFDPYVYSMIDSTIFSYGDGTIDSLSLDSSSNIDTIIFHEYPGCGHFKRLVEYNFTLQGKNVQSANTYMYCEQSVSFDTPNMFYYDSSPSFDLNYEIVRCKSESFNLNVFKNELNGDSLFFELLDNNGSLPIPDGALVNSSTGELFWNSQPDTGLYHFIMNITEMRFGSHIMGRYMARFSIKVTDSCINLPSRDNIDNNNLFEVEGREFHLSTNEAWNYSFRIAKEGWDSISVNPSSEIFEHSFFESDYTIIDIGDSVAINVSWITDSIYKRNHPYIITYHVTAYKNGKAHHRVLTNSIYVDWPLGLNQPEQEATYFKIHPNPTTGQTTITSTTKVKRLELFSVSGFKLEEFETLNDMPADIDIGHLPNGLYFLRIKTKKETVTKRIVKTTTN